MFTCCRCPSFSAVVVKATGLVLRLKWKASLVDPSRNLPQPFHMRRRPDLTPIARKRWRRLGLLLRPQKPWSPRRPPAFQEGRPGCVTSRTGPLSVQMAACQNRGCGFAEHGRAIQNAHGGQIPSARCPFHKGLA